MDAFPSADDMRARVLAVTDPAVQAMLDAAKEALDNAGPCDTCVDVVVSGERAAVTHFMRVVEYRGMRVWRVSKTPEGDETFRISWRREDPEENSGGVRVSWYHK